jgi:hypothetical protein
VEQEGKDIPTIAVVGTILGSVVIGAVVLFLALASGNTPTVPDPVEALPSPVREVSKAPPKVEADRGRSDVDAATPPTATPPPTKAPAPPVTAGLSTTSPGMVYENFRTRGYRIEKDVANGVWTCMKTIGSTRYLVEIYGTPTAIRRINMSVTTTIDKDVDAIAAPEMRFAASVIYDGSRPDEAVQFVESSLGRDESRSIGGVTFRLRAPSKSGRLLEMY